MPDLVLSSDMRVGCLGRTRAGKTYLMGALLAQQPRVLVIDDKHRCNFPGYYLTENESAALLEPKTIFRPKGPIPTAFWEDVLTFLNEQGGGIVYIDELSEQSNSNKMDAGLRSIFRLGGELGVGVWWSAQSATEIHNVAIRQSNVLILFKNVGASDRDKVIRTAGDLGEVTAHLPLYEFVVYESDGESYDPASIPAYKLRASEGVTA